MADKKMKIQFSDAAVEYLGNFKYNAKYGAGSIRHSIQQNVENELADGIKRGYFKDGVAVSVDVEVMDFGTEPSNEQARLTPSAQLFFFFKQ